MTTNGKTKIMLVSVGVVLSAGSVTLPAYYHLDSKIETRIENVRKEADLKMEKMSDTLVLIREDLSAIKQALKIPKKNEQSD